MFIQVTLDNKFFLSTYYTYNTARISRIHIIIYVPSIQLYLGK